MLLEYKSYLIRNARVNVWVTISLLCPLTVLCSYLQFERGFLSVVKFNFMVLLLEMSMDFL